jgi:hypothetical protein
MSDLGLQQVPEIVQTLGSGHWLAARAFAPHEIREDIVNRLVNASRIWSSTKGVPNAFPRHLASDLAKLGFQNEILSPRFKST